MSRIEQARRVFEIEIEELTRLSGRIGADFDRAVEALLACLQAKNKIIVCGVGKSGNIARKFAATLNSTGATSVNLNAQDALHGDLGVMDEGDVVVLLSYSGGTQELVDLLPHLRRSAAVLIAITGGGESVLAKNSDIVLDVAVQREACPLNLAPTSSTTSMLVLCDALAMVLLEARGLKHDDFARYHPNGSLGRQLTKASDVMRSGDALALVTPDTTVSAALKAMTKARAGAAIIVDAAGKLAGVFTHGDFVRAFQKDAAISNHAVSTYMTRNPVHVSADRLAPEVLAILEKHRVDDLVVVNARGDPVGMVDTQDLTRMKWM
jgi:arabinose-5-phosphate isomerase